jgi:4-amino-4-deoxy-L-arabinose transferase-like glycosyltransferase
VVASDHRTCRLALACAALAALTALRLLIAATVPLSPDETYYWVWSRALAGGYLDHPPMVALWIRAGMTLAGSSALGIRLLAPLAAGVGSLLVWHAGERLLPGRQTGLIAACLLNVTLVLGIGAVMMTPDTPLLFFWVCALWAMSQLALGGRSAWWLAVGLFTGLAFDSKYTGAFLVVGIALWLLIVAPNWLARPGPWLGGAVALAVAAPVLYWNAAHDWISFAKQGGRLDEWRVGRTAQYLLELIAGQVGLATPLVFVLCVGGIVAAGRRTWRARDPAATLLTAMTVPPVLIFLEHTLGERVQGNWPAIIYPAGVLAAAGLLRFRRRGEQRTLSLGGARADGPRICSSTVRGAADGQPLRAATAAEPPMQERRVYTAAILLGLVMTGLVYLHATVGLFPIAIRYDPVALQLAGWPDLVRQIETVREKTSAAFVAADQYGIASQIAYWRPAHVRAIALGQRWRLFNLPPARIAGTTGLLIRSTRRGEISQPLPWARLKLISVAQRARNGVPVETYLIYQISPTANPAGAAALPGRYHETEP